MRLIRIKALIVAAFFGLAALILLLQLFGQAPAALAREEALLGPVDVSSSAQATRPDFDIDYTIVTTDLYYYDSSGTALGKVLYELKLKCVGDNCSHKASVMLSDTAFEYKFSSRLAFNPSSEQVIVAGKGTMTSEGQKQRFRFTATLENNLDGTISSYYEASIPGASFNIPKAVGTVEIRDRSRYGASTPNRKIR